MMTYVVITFDFNFLLHVRYKALGTKRLASDEFVHDWDNKRLNVGNVRIHEIFLMDLDYFNVNMYSHFTTFVPFLFSPFLFYQIADKWTAAIIPRI